jgi:hypothetical protein
MDARGEIENTLFRWTWYFDMQQIDKIGECFSEDAEYEFDTGDIKVGREAIVEELRRRRARYGDSAPRHVNTNVFVAEQSDSEATVKSFVMAIASRGESDRQIIRPMSIWHDEFVNVNGAWLIRKRSVEV